MTRWAETEELAEQWFRAHGWQYATRRGRAGHIDIENMPGLCPEVKSGNVWETRWLKDPYPAGMKFILWRPPKFGPASVGRLTDDQYAWLRMLEDAGQDSGEWRPADLLDGTIARELAALAGVTARQAT